jgi:hypothetical protein
VYASTGLGLEHGDIEEYGGMLLVVGWLWMGAWLVGLLGIGVLAARRGDFQSHRRWMIRWFGAMWGSFLIFRLGLMVLALVWTSHYV